jgi:transcriptional regulator with XRE-family HTH domain
MTQAELAEAAGLSDETIGRLERDAFEPSLSTLSAVQRALGVGALGGIAAPPPHRYSPVVQKLADRAEHVGTKGQLALLALAKLLPEVPRRG